MALGTFLKRVFTKKLKYQAEFVNLDRASRMALLIDKGDAGQLSVVGSIKQHIGKCDLTVFQLQKNTDTKDKEEFVKLDETCFNFLGKVKKDSEAAPQIIDSEYDILIDFSSSKSSTRLNFINNLMCKTKVARYSDSNKNYNLVLKFSENVSSEEFANQAIYYLKNINRQA